MLNKDQYNQDEYNDYYAQETRGAEISNSGEDNGGNIKKIIFIILLLLIIAGAGYFGWKSMNNSKDTTTTQTATTLENTNEEATSSSSEAEKVAKEVQTIALNSDEKMNQEDIANIVQMVMKKMNQEAPSDETTSEPEIPLPVSSSEDQAKDNELMESLSGTEADSLSTTSESSVKSSSSDNDKKASKSNEKDTYNKIIVQSDTDLSATDELSQLSNEISSVINAEEEITPSTATSSTVDNSYTESITKEVKTRTREMRYIVVKKGDTLGKIAKRAYGNVMDFKKIYDANPDILRRADKIYIGQKLRIP